MLVLQKELSVHKYVKIPEVPTFTGGAIGFVTYESQRVKDIWICVVIRLEVDVSGCGKN